MLSPEEAATLKARNYRSIKEMIIVTYMLGANIMKPSRLGNVLKIWTVILIANSLVSIYGHWSMFVRYRSELPRIVETISTFFQTQMSTMKLVYYLFIQYKFYLLLKRVASHDLLMECEIFKAGFPVEQELKDKIDQIMTTSWTKTRRQLIFYLSCCSLILCNYYITSIAVNLYHYYTIPDGKFEIILPFPAIYPIVEEYGMSFPYYPIIWFIEGACLYIAGMCAFSFDGFFIVLCMHGVGLMQSLNEMIKSSTSALVPRERRVEYLRYCIYQYQRINAYAIEVNNLFRHLILVQFLLSLIVWGLVLFNMSVGLVSDRITLLRMIMYLAAAGYQSVLYCYNGQLFSSASEEIPYAFYDCDWYEESREFQQLNKMMIMRSNRIMNLDVSWFTKMSLPTLMWMMKTSGQYFLMLQNVTQK